MNILANVGTIADPPRRIDALRRATEHLADGAAPLFDAYRPYVAGLDQLPADGRFLLVGNHTQFGAEALLIPYYVRRAIGRRVRPLTDRQFGRMPGPAADVLSACGAVVGSPESAGELMRRDEPILVFPGGAREIAKFKGEAHTLRWDNRSGFARIAIEHRYPIVPVALVGGDDVYRSLSTRGGTWDRLTTAVNRRMSGRSDMSMPLMRGLGPTLIPRPERMYLQFAARIETVRPQRISAEDWTASVKERTQQSLEQTVAELLEIQRGDPYRKLNPLGWRRAARPPVG